jgi:hypothetical protein
VCARGDDAGFTLLELTVATAMLLVISVMAMGVVLAARNTASTVMWRSETNTTIRDIIDGTFADLSTARPLPTCVRPGPNTPIGSCDKVSETIDATAPGQIPGVLLSATATNVCYLSQRKAPVLTASTTVTSPFWKVCLGVTGDQLVLSAYRPIGTYTNITFTQTPIARPLGTVDAATKPFVYRDIDGNTIAAASLATSLNRIALVTMEVRVTEVVNGKQVRTRAMTFTAALRASRYQQERWWNGDKGL